MRDRLPNIIVLGASGLIGDAIAIGLMRRGFPVIPVARQFTTSQTSAFSKFAAEHSITEYNVHELAQLLSEWRPDIVVNCVGILQDGLRERTNDVHVGFVIRLLEALRRQPDPTHLVHLSIPGSASNDRTQFSRTKREAERLIAASAMSFVVLRPGFVVAPTAYGGGALIRALAALPFDLPKCESVRPFASIDISDIVETVAVMASRWRTGERNWCATWDAMGRRSPTVGEVVNSFRSRFGGPRPIGRLPSCLLEISARVGDVCALLGWKPPIRTTALREMRRGVDGNPDSWIVATRIEPAPLDETLAALPASVQEKWFGRVYLAKPVVLGSLAAFWIASGLIALTAASKAASAILVSHGIPPVLAHGVALGGALADVAVGTAIAVKSTCHGGLLAGIALSVLYMAGATLIAPGLWIEPLGAIIKIVPAVILMLVGLAILADR